MSGKGSFKVGDCLVEQDLDRISRGSEGVTVRPQVMDVLVFLASRSGQIVHADELLEGLWPGKVVTSASVYNCITELRHAFLSCDNGQPYVDTVPKRGYRLVASVTGLDESKAAASQNDAAPFSRRMAFIVISLLAAAVLLLTWYTWWPAAPMDKSIAVMAFENMSDDPEQEYFSDGLSDELLNKLAKIEDFRVTGRTSSFSFKGKDTDIQTIGKKLHVQTILDGSVRKAGDQIRITAQLVNVEDGFQLWSETYDRNMDNIFEVQDEIASAVVRALKQTLLPTKGRAAIDDRPTDNVEAYKHYLRGKYHLRRGQNDDTEKAREEFQLATMLDPDFALAYTGLADSYAHANPDGVFIHTHEEVRPLAQAAVDHAMSINDQLSEAWASQSLLYDDVLFDGASRMRMALEKAVELNPNNAMAWLWLGTAIPWPEGNEAVKVGKEAYNRDPLHPTVLTNLARRYSTIGEFDEARRVAQELIDLNPDSYRGYSTMALVSWSQGRWDDVIRWSKKAFERNPDGAWDAANIAEFYVRLGDLQQAETWAQRVVAIDPTFWDSARILAAVRYQSGDTEEALALLNEHLEQNQDYGESQANLAYIELLTGNYPRALELYESVMSFDAGDKSWSIEYFNCLVCRRSPSAPYFAFLLRETGDMDKSRAVTDELLRYNDKHEVGGWRNYTIARDNAKAYAVRQDKERTISSLRAAFELGWSGESWLDHDPLWDQLRQDIRFVALLDEMRAKRQAMLESLAAEDN